VLINALVNSCEFATTTNHSTRSCSRLLAAIGQMKEVDQYSSGVSSIHLVSSPSRNGHVGRSVGAIRQPCLDRMIVSDGSNPDLSLASMLPKGDVDEELPRREIPRPLPQRQLSALDCAP